MIKFLPRDFLGVSQRILWKNENAVSGFVEVMENLESHGIEVFQFPGLESRGI